MPGVRHALVNGTLLIAQSLTDIPSDLLSYGTIVYDTSPAGSEKFRRDIKDQLVQYIKDPKRPDNPVSDFLRAEESFIQSSRREEALRGVTAVLTELSSNLRTMGLGHRRYGKMASRKPSRATVARSSAPVVGGDELHDSGPKHRQAIARSLPIK